MCDYRSCNHGSLILYFKINLNLENQYMADIDLNLFIIEQSGGRGWGIGLLDPNPTWPQPKPASE